MSSGTECPNCGGKNLSWGQTCINQGQAQDGRIRMSEVECSFFVGCDDCSETVMIVSADKIVDFLMSTRLVAMRHIAHTYVAARAPEAAER